MTNVLREREIDFLLYEFLDTASLTERARYRQHSVDVFRQILEVAHQVAAQCLLPHYQKGDTAEPTFDGTSAMVLPETRAAWDVIRRSGFLKVGTDEADGGLQLPEVIGRTILAYFLAADGPSTAYYFLTMGVINLLRSFGSAEQKRRYLPLLLEGECTGTMALTEPGQGSALADIRTRAVRQADGAWRLFGQKMFISGGDHNLTPNIVHMVLARSRPEVAGIGGVSLFMVPKFLIDENGRPALRNDVALSGLLHKMGSRNSTSTVLNFGENEGARGWLVGEEGRGLACMFQMMNESRIGVGIGAAAVALRGFYCSLEYAKQRPQGRLPSNKDPRTPQVMLTEHADVRRMLIAQKVYGEGALALCLYAASLFEDQHTLKVEAGRRRAAELLDLLTPVVKSWSSRYGCVSNDLAIQVLGGAGYMREYPVEQLYRDQRLNPIHEGAEGIHGVDLLGRKLRLNGGAALRSLEAEILATITQAQMHAGLHESAKSLGEHLALLIATTSQVLVHIDRRPDEGLANATAYLDVFGRLTVAWIWLRQAVVAEQAILAGAAGDELNFYIGKQQAARYYFEWELPACRHMCERLTAPSLVAFEFPVSCL